MKTNTKINRVSVTGGLLRKVMLFCMLFLTFGLGSMAQNFPFPQNYKYPYGITATNTNTAGIQAIYSEWKATYYTESGTQARIKFQQPGEDGSATVSEGIGYGMLIMVYMDNSTNNTKACFDKLFNYYKASLDGNGLMNWKVKGWGTPTVIDANAAPDADIDVAQALLLAAKQWNDASYQTAAMSLIDKIWAYETQPYSGFSNKRLIKPGDMFDAVLNPSYFITNALKLFAQAGHTQGTAWNDVAQNHYDLIKVCQNSSTGLVPDWVWPSGALITQGQNLGNACNNCTADSKGIGAGKFESYFLYDAIRVPWRFAQAYAWYGDADAKLIVDKVANWVNTSLSGQPEKAVDGYTLAGQAATGLTAPLNNKGIYSNACFTGGLGISAMTNSANQTLLNKTFSETVKSEGANSQYFTTTTQLLYLLCMTGNMPNFYDMNPAPAKAYNDATGGCSKIYVEFNKPMLSSSVSSSGWSVTMDNLNTPIPVTVTGAALSGSNNKVIILTLAAPTEEPVIEVAYSGTSLKSADNKVVAAFSDFPVKDNLFCARPYAQSAATNVFGDTVLIVFSKAMDKNTFSKGDYSVKINGSPVGTNDAIDIDPTDPLILRLDLPSGLVASKSDVITVTYTPGALKSADGGTVRGFTNMPVINNFLTETCYDIETVDPLKMAWGTWSPGGTLSTSTANPSGTGTVIKFTKNVGTGDTYMYASAQGSLSKVATTDSTLNARIKTAYLLKFKIRSDYAGANVRVRLQDKFLAGNAWKTAISANYKCVAANTWYDVVLDFKSQKETTTNLNQIQIDVEPEALVTSARAIFFDDIKLCEPPATTDFDRGFTTIDGKQVKVKFTTAMAVPTNLADFVFSTGNIISVAIDDVDKSMLIFTMDAAYGTSDIITLSYTGTSAKGLNGIKLSQFLSQPILNLRNRAVAFGWRDDFDVTGDYVTTNIGGGKKDADTYYTWTENVAAGTLPVTVAACTVTYPGMNGDYISFGPNVSNVLSEEVWDITADPNIRFRASVPSGQTVWIRADVVDLINARSTDAIPAIQLTADGAQHDYVIPLAGKLVNKYGDTGPVDATNIVACNLYIWKTDGATNPDLWPGTVTFDYISIGATLRVYATSTTAPMGGSATGKATVNGEIYVVPGGTPRLAQALKDSVTRGVAVKATCTKDALTTVPLGTLAPGYYDIYAYNPVTGEVSRKAAPDGLQITDVTAPIITQNSTGNYSRGAAVTVTVNEDAVVYMVPTGTAKDKTAIQLAAVVSEPVAKDVTTALSIPVTVDLASSWIFYAIDYSDNISNSKGTVTVIDAGAPVLTDITTVVQNKTTGSIAATSNEAATIYVIKKADIGSINYPSDLGGYAVSSVSATAGVPVSIATASFDVGLYVLYAVDPSDNMYGPSVDIDVRPGCITPSIVTITQANQTLNHPQTTLLTFSVTPADATIENVIWTASPGAPFTVTPSGNNASITTTSVTAVTSGTISVSIGDCSSGTITSAARTITVNPEVVCPSAMNIAPTSLQLQVGQTGTLTPTVTGTGTYSIAWSSSSNANASVTGTNASATVTGNILTGGSPVTITATLSCNGIPDITSSASVEVVATPVSSVAFTTPSATTHSLTIGGSLQTAIEVLPSGATNKTVTYTSSNPSVATISSTGLINASAVGYTNITVTSQADATKFDLFELTVSGVGISSILASPTTLNIPLGGSQDVTIAYNPTSATNKDLSTDVADKSIASVITNPGTVTVTGSAIGSTTLTITSLDNPNATATVTVNVTCPVTAPTASEVPNKSYCVGTTTNIKLTSTVSLNWYDVQTGGSALASNVTQFTHNKTAAGVYTFYAAKTDGSCESTTRLAVTLTINALPVVSITGVNATVCKSAAPFTPVLSPTGGSLSMDYAPITGAINPATLDAMVHSLSYSYTNPTTTCSASTTFDFEVIDAQVPTITTVPAQCSNSPAVTLSATPAGGTFNGTGVTGSQFTPSATNVGTNTITYTVTSNGCVGTATADITVNATPAVAFQGMPTSVCEGDAPINLTTKVNIAGGTFNGTNVSGTTFTPTTVGASAITYSVTTNGCTGTANASVTVTAKPTVTITPVGPLCGNGTAVTLSATPTGGTFSGSGVTGTSFNPAGLSGSNTITYAITTGCATSGTTIVEVNNATAPVAADKSVGLGESVTFNATASGSIQWYDNSRTPINGATSASYTSDATATGNTGDVFTFYVSNTENGCTSDLVEVSATVSSCLTAAPTVTTASYEICEGAAAPTLTATGTSLKWYIGSATTSVADGPSYQPTITAVGSYTYKVTQTDACESVASTITVTVNAKPAAPAVTGAEICFGQPAEAIVAVGTPISWKDDSGAEVSTSASYTPTVTAAGTYSYFATTTNAKGCVSNETEATYSILALPSAPVVTATNTCEGTAASFNATGSNITWYADGTTTTSAGTGATFTVATTTAGSHTYYASQRTGECVSPRGNATATINAKPDVSITIADNTLCVDAGPQTLTLVPATGGNVTGLGVTGTTFNPSTGGGSYTLTHKYTDANNCSNSNTVSITVTAPATPVVTNASQSIMVGGTIPSFEAKVSDAGTISWESATGAAVGNGGTFTPSVDNSAAGTHTFTAVNTLSGCESQPVSVTLTITDCNTGLPTASDVSSCEGSTVPSLKATGTDLKWYSSTGTSIGTGETYTPTVTAAGTYDYYVSQTVGCEGPQKKVTLTINALPSIDFAPLADVCQDAPNVTLSAQPNGGSFSGLGVSGTTFNPHGLSDDQTITYTVKANNCTNVATQTITVTEVQPPVIDNPSIVTAVNITPTAFTATGTGIVWYSDASLLSSVGSGTSYQADAQSVIGTYLYYATQTVSGCKSASATATLNVSACPTQAPTVTNAQMCLGGTIPALTATGTDLKWYSDAAKTQPINGATTSYTPTSATQTTSYYVTQTETCEGPAATVTLTVNALPVVSMSDIADICSDASPVTLDGAPSGGVYSGDVTSATINPVTLGAGNYSVTYTVTNSTTSCSKAVTKPFVVKNCALPDVDITSININAVVSVNVGATSPLTAIIEPTNATNQTLTWTSADPTIASVDPVTGEVKGEKAGSTTITAKANDPGAVVSNTCTVTVSDIKIPVTGVTFDQSTVSVLENGTFDLRSIVKVQPSNATVQTITYTVADQSVVTVDVDGGATAKTVSTGQTASTSIIIKVTGTDGSTAEGIVTFTVTKAAVPPTSVTIDPGTLALQIGHPTLGTATVSATVYPTDATNKNVVYSSSNPSVAKVDPASGLVTAVGVGNASITATTEVGGFTSSCAVNVTEILLTNLSFSQTQVNLNSSSTINLSQYLQFYPTTAANKTVNFSIDIAEQSSATVNNMTGIVTPLVPSDTITVTATSANGLVATIKVIITTATIPVTSVNIDPATLDVVLTQKQRTFQQKLVATIEPSNATDQNLSWSSSNSSVVSVDQSGNILVSGTSNTTVKITASSSSGRFAESTISVVYRIAVDSAAITTSVAPIEVNTTLQLEAKSYPIATNKTATWDIVNTTSTGAQINPTTGLLTAGTTPGVVTVRATVTDADGLTYTDQIDVTVMAEVVKLTGITALVNGSSNVTINKNETANIVIAYTPANTEQTQVNYSSSDNSVVTVDNNGTILAVGGGTATIRVTPSANVDLEQVITVTVIEPVENVRITALKNAINVNEKLTITVVVTQSTATNKTILVTSSNNAKATVEPGTTANTYIITGVSEGSATITAEATDGSGKSAQVTINIEKVAVTGVTVNPLNMSLAVGDSKKISATVTPSNASNNGVIFQSSDPTVAMVDQSGNVTAIAVGYTSITVTSSDNSTITKAIGVEVVKKPLDLYKLDSLFSVAFDVYDEFSKKDTKKELLDRLVNAMDSATAILNSVDNPDGYQYTQDEVDALVKELGDAISSVRINEYVDVAIESVVAVNVAPNPVTDVLTIVGNGVISVTIIDVNGKVVAQSNNAEINISNVPAGVYVVKITTVNNVVIKEISKL